MGEAFLILREMMYDSIPVLIFMALAAVTVGVAFAVGLHLPADQHAAVLPALGPTQPFAAGFWAALGGFALPETGVADLYNTHRERFNWMPVLLFFQALLTMVFMVNLMIAKMTSTYERIRSESQEYRALQHAQFILEFKDERSAPPPLNLLTSIFAGLPSRWTGLIPAYGPRGFAVTMGHAASVRLQTREREHAQAFHRQRKRDASCSTSGRIAAIHEDLPTLRSLGKRCASLESEIAHLRAQHDSSNGAIHAKLDELLAVNKRPLPPTLAASSHGEQELIGQPADLPAAAPARTPAPATSTSPSIIKLPKQFSWSG